MENTPRCFLKPQYKFNSKRIHDLRKQLGLDKSAFAELIGLGPSIFTYWDDGGIPSYKTILSICNATGVDPSYFVSKTYVWVCACKEDAK